MPADRRAAGTVLVTWMGFDPHGGRTGSRLQAAGLRIDLAPRIGHRDAGEMARLLAGHVAAIVSTDPIDAGALAAATELRVIARVGVGTDSIDLDAATAAGVVVTITPGANRETTADHGLAMMLAAVRRVTEHDASVRRGEWDRGGALTPWELNRTTVGLVGCGEIGRAVAQRLAGFGVALLVADPDPAAGSGFECVELDDLLRRSDLVSLHLPLNDRTRGLIGRRELALMPPGSILVNTSRGGIVDEAALEAAVRSGHLGAAALDVFAEEPGVPAGLAALPNVVLTPHIGGLSRRSIDVMTERATGHVLETLAGRPPVGAVANPAVLANRRRGVLA
jgi:phosphoglycerate dehydrogenase-like enzyme